MASKTSYSLLERDSSDSDIDTDDDESYNFGRLILLPNQEPKNPVTYHELSATQLEQIFESRTRSFLHEAAQPPMMLPIILPSKIIKGKSSIVSSFNHKWEVLRNKVFNTNKLELFTVTELYNKLNI